MFESVKSQVELILEIYPETRNSDIFLTVAVWKKFYGKLVHYNLDEEKHFIYCADLLELPSQDNIKRIRANIQNTQHRFLPTDIAVLKQRKINEIWWHQEFSPSNPSRG